MARREWKFPQNKGKGPCVLSFDPQGPFCRQIMSSLMSPASDHICQNPTSWHPHTYTFLFSNLYHFLPSARKYRKEAWPECSGESEKDCCCHPLSIPTEGQQSNQRFCGNVYQEVTAWYLILERYRCGDFYHISIQFACFSCAKDRWILRYWQWITVNFSRWQLLLQLQFQMWFLY